MGVFLWRLSLVLLVATVVGYEVLCPYIKVEESFNMQATHDLMHTAKLEDYDHHMFPGVVPRTAVGALLLGGIALPVARAVGLVLPQDDAMLASHIVRIALGLMFVAAVQFLGLAFAPPPAKPAAAGKKAKKVREDHTSLWLNVLVASQFHLCFYSTRTLPNTFALILVTVAVGLLFRSRPYSCFALLGFTGSVFRGDMFVLIAPLALAMVVTGEVNIFKGAVVGFMAIVCSVAATAPFDSYFWRRPLWPEGEVLYFNTAENKSHEWGTEPPHWYFSSALPKSFTMLLPVMLWAAYQSKAKVRSSFVASIVFIALYSFLPHKELRFILPAFPILLLPLARWAPPPSIATARKGALFVLTVAVMANSCSSVLGVMMNLTNYPGGEALNEVHQFIGNQQKGESSVYLDAFACMNGITRFNKRRDHVRYNKDPQLFNSTANIYTTPDQQPFDFLVVRHSDVEWHQTHGYYEVAHVVNTYAGIRQNLLPRPQWPPLTIKAVPFLAILRRKQLS